MTRPAKCGTDSGYYRHLRGTQTEPCTPCKTAHAAAAQARYKGRLQRFISCDSCGEPSSSGLCRTCWLAEKAAQREAARRARALANAAIDSPNVITNWRRDGLIWRAAS